MQVFWSPFSKPLTGDARKFSRHHPDVTNGVAFTSNSRLLATGCWDRQIRFWNLDTGERQRTLMGHTSAVNDLDFSEKDDLLASSSGDRTVRLWDTKTGKVLATFKGHAREVYGVRFSPNGKIIASGSWDATIKLWDVRDEEGDYDAAALGFCWDSTPRRLRSMATQIDGDAVGSRWDRGRAGLLPSHPLFGRRPPVTVPGASPR